MLQIPRYNSVGQPDKAHERLSQVNQKTYERLKLALSLGLRRQVFLAVCDDMRVRNSLAVRLHLDLTKQLDDLPCCPMMVSLNLDLENPNLSEQMNRYIKDNSGLTAANLIPSFQIIGLEKLTRQSLSVQRAFIRYLQGFVSLTKRGFPILKSESSVLLWMSRPWLNMIKQGAPDFWKIHTGLFEFEGEPTPICLDDVLIPSQEELIEEKESIPLVELEQSYDIKGEIDDVVEKEKTSLDLASDYLKLGASYREQVINPKIPLPLNEMKHNIIQAIEAYEKSVYYFQLEHKVPPDLLNDLGNLYWMLSRQTNPDERDFILELINKAINTYQSGIKLSGQEPDVYAMLQNNLGAAYGDLSRYENHSQNLEKSITAYQLALIHRPKEVDLIKYAVTQNNIGTAYWYLAQYQDPVSNLERAITAYQLSLQQYHDPEYANNWAMLHNNLGTAYWNLAQYKQPEIFLPLSISHYQHALAVRTPQKVPDACAATLNNLGTAYWHLATLADLAPQKQREYLQNCITAYTEGIAIARQVVESNYATLTFDLLSTNNNVALAHYQIATLTINPLDKKGQQTHLDAALGYHLEALKGYSEDSEEYQATFLYVIRVIRTMYQDLGIAGQNKGLSMLPAYLLPMVLNQL